MERGPLNLLVIFILVVKVKDGKLKMTSFSAHSNASIRAALEIFNKLLLSTTFVWRTVVYLVIVGERSQVY